jgi:MerR family mercuric resistance operon transcriptional regulator
VHRSNKAELTIGKVARRAGVRIDTVRFYEREGLLPRPPRSRSSNYRVFSDDDVRRIQFVQRAKTLGFTLREAGELLALRVDSRTSCARVIERAEAKLSDVDLKIAELARMRTALVALARQCRGRTPAAACPFLDALDDAEAERAPRVEPPRKGPRHG